MDSVTALPHTGPLTRAELDALPDDGRRHELVDGVLVVTPAPVPRHQAAVLELAVLLRGASPVGLQVFVAPVDLVLGPADVLQPDLLVTERRRVTARDVSGPPLLAVEVLSPGTRRVDLTLKHARYEAAGCPSYWVVDPDEPRLLAWELRERRYAQVADAGPGDEWTATAPYAVTVRPADLVS